MRLVHTDEEGRQNFDPALPLPKGCSRKQGTRKLPLTSETAYMRALTSDTVHELMTENVRVNKCDREGWKFR